MAAIIKGLNPAESTFLAGLVDATAPKKKADRAQLSKIELARTRFEHFIAYTMPEYEMTRYHHSVARVLDYWAAGEIPRLMLFMPPQHSKSEQVSRRLPAFCFGRNPDENVIACSYGATLAHAMNRDVQRIMDGPRYRELFPHVRLFDENVRTMAHGRWLRNSDEFEIVGRHGYYRCAGVGGGIGGRSGTRLIIDDVIKDAKEANSATYRDNVWEWYNQVFRMRRKFDKASILITMTRWHGDDLAGRLEELAKSIPGSDQWVILLLSGVCEMAGVSPISTTHPDVFVPEEIRQLMDPRQPGDVLWPTRHSKIEVEKTRASIGSYAFSALYQQRPSPPEGIVFKKANFRYFHEEYDDNNRIVFVLADGPGIAPRRILAEQCWFFQTWDTALTVSDSAAYSACLTLAVTPQYDMLVYHAFRQRLLVPEQYEAIKQMRLGAALFDEGGRKWALTGSMAKWPKPLAYQAVEQKASGYGLIQQAQADGLPFHILKANEDKNQRAMNAITMYENGKVFHKRNAVWLDMLEGEELAHPTGKYKDLVDCIAYGAIVVCETRITTGDAGESDRDYVMSPKPPKPGDPPVRIEDVAGGQNIRIGEVDVYFPDDDDGWGRGRPSSGLWR
ncbi:MAG TPA: hypothetical protein VGX70_01560 [Gemmataceae bacterium]|jgi:phage terminase large subunit-like protein|nr:hypothetical protein [Gemmataceae bacterium]